VNFAFRFFLSTLLPLLRPAAAASQYLLPLPWNKVCDISHQDAHACTRIAVICPLGIFRRVMHLSNATRACLCTCTYIIRGCTRDVYVSTRVGMCLRERERELDEHSKGNEGGVPYYVCYIPARPFSHAKSRGKGSQRQVIRPMRFDGAFFSLFSSSLSLHLAILLSCSLSPRLYYLKVLASK
jgi:hypothetical protein